MPFLLAILDRYTSPRQYGDVARTQMLTAQDVADVLHVAVRTVYVMLDRGDLSEVRIGKARRIEQEELERFIKGGGVRARRERSEARA